MNRINKIKVTMDLENTERNTVYLIHEYWDDWFTYETEYRVVYYDNKLEKYEIGFVKIGQRNQSERVPDLPEECASFSEKFFSLGINETYYEALKKMPIREELLIKMNDIAYNIDLFEEVKQYNVTTVSLLRDITSTTVRGQFNRMANGGARLTDYNFTYIVPSKFAGENRKLLFSVECEVKPPSNIHVLIGKNGTGKTTILKRMLYAVERCGTPEQVGKMEGDSFANVVFVSFSAFDMSISPDDLSEFELDIPYTFVGLVEKEHIKSGKVLAEDFSKSLYKIIKGTKKSLWNKAIEVLESDSTFIELNVREWSNYKGQHYIETDLSEKEIESRESEEKITFEKNIIAQFKRLSSGHKVILLTIVKLIELVEEKTLVLLDEPEEHLHPPLVAAFIRSLSDLLIYRNGVGIIATHSPVIVQEVPKRCVWILRRSGNELVAERPCIETFGENVGELTSEIFGYEVTNSGFHKMLKEVSEKKSTYRSAEKEFNSELGKEARSILKSYMYEKDKQ
ncbi:ATP-binding cassette domain-containing protein [Clostridium sp. OF10-22XD]|nr:ATP-binding cassette domain-containing protein [Clostridium sp. OF10-22XD]